MANDLENKVDDIKDVDEVEADDVDTDEDDELEGYQEHKFSLFDSPIEVATVVFMAALFIFRVWDCVNTYINGTDVMNILRFMFDLVLELVPAIILLVACEIHEKMEKMEYNLRLNSEYMAMYQQDLLTRMNVMDKKSDK